MASEKQTEGASFSGPSGIPSIVHVFLYVQERSTFLIQGADNSPGTSFLPRKKKSRETSTHARTKCTGRAFFPFSIITGPQLGSISGYFKLLSRCAVPAGRRNFAECLLREISSARSKTNSSSSSLVLDERRSDEGRRFRSVAILSAVAIRLSTDFFLL